MSTASYSRPRRSSCARARSQRLHPCPWKKRILGIEPARDGRLGDTLDGEPVGGHPHRRLALLVSRPCLVERARDDRVQASVHLVFLPEVLLETLYPLEVGDDDA